VIMTPSAKELADGQKACERLEAFQRTRGPGDLLIFLCLVAGTGIWGAFERDGWKAALVTGAVWLVITAAGIYQFKKQKKRAEKDHTFLANLKAKYGDSVYSEIQKCPHSLFYCIFQKRFPPFSRQSVKLP
jgi:hypothetical protein